MTRPPIDGHDALLLLSGGMDSAALAAWVRPAAALFVNYGQRPAQAEERAAHAIAGALDIPFDKLTVDLSALGSGLMHADSSHLKGDVPQTEVRSLAEEISPSPEWWPLRNQLLCTIAAAWALGGRVPHGVRIKKVLTATVGTDGARHVDGTPGFYSAIDTLTSMQEGGIRILAPVGEMAPEQLLVESGISEDVLAWSHSCHRASSPCSACPGCWKREQLLDHVRRLGYPATAHASKGGHHTAEDSDG